jgi:hypothetical protein
LTRHEKKYVAASLAEFAIKAPMGEIMLAQPTYTVLLNFGVHQVASIENRSNYEVTVKNRADLTKTFSHLAKRAAEKYRQTLESQKLKPRLSRLDNSFIVRVRSVSHKNQTLFASSAVEAQDFKNRIESEHRRSIFTCMQLAGLAGVNVAQCRPAPMSTMTDHPELVAALGPGTRFLAVDRFDRGPGSAVHMEDACQLLTLMPGQKYSGAKQFVKLIQVLDRLGTRGIEDVRQFFVRQTVNTLLGNSHAHLKNFSVLYHDGVRPELSPAYDIVCVSALPGFRGFGTNVAIDKLQRQETLDTYAAIATQAGISERIAKAAVTQTVSLAKDLWPKALRDMDVPDAVRLEIEDRLNTLPLAGGAKP